ncbi:hypothetical protein, partial [Gordonia sp. YY1]|uniref:hypothetical protein n=1 Tax=Gordonia sp. YY1 TaxID=396712 RepID=UPI002E2BDAD6
MPDPPHSGYDSGYDWGADTCCGPDICGPAPVSGPVVWRIWVGSYAGSTGAMTVYGALMMLVAESAAGP